MHFFTSKHEEKLSDRQRSKLYLADSLIREIDEALKDNGAKNLRSIKSALFDIVVLENVLRRIEFKCELVGDLRDIRNSLAHIDERMEQFNFQPALLTGFTTNHEKHEDGKTKSSATINFQGAVDSARVGIPIGAGASSINVVSLYGMVGDKFLWVDKEGNQRSTDTKTIRNEYKELLNSLKQ